MRPAMELRRFRGCMLGAAVGDALGAPLEAMSRRQIQDTFNGTVNRYVSSARHPRLSLGQWTDDTALSLATGEILISKGEVNINEIGFAMRMAFTLESFRGYGLTTRKAFNDTNHKGRGIRPSNGAAMRIAPVALFSCHDLDSLASNVINVSRITHPHPDSIDGALAVAFAVATAARGELETNGLIEQTIEFLGPQSEMGYKLREVDDLLQADISTSHGLEHIGTRGYALETVGSAFFAFLKSPESFYNSIVEVINAGGDTDTIGSITGAISGTFNGVEAIPR
ncbi:MAG: ADP-ribosylglycohydrolase family protein, partial [Candidatus Margulisbacteria bacterium]|nr:ADP-ribosylglycohydrolase family protein [Candidatus Margulisiibacteriota bacterium]